MNEHVKEILKHHLSRIDNSLGEAKSNLEAFRNKVRSQEDYIDYLHEQRKQITEELENK